MRVATKAEMYDLYHGGAFGNKLRTWPDLDSYFRDAFIGPVCLRYAGKHGGSWVAFGVRKADVSPKVREWMLQGADQNLVRVSEQAPDHLMILQGHVRRTEGGLQLECSSKRTNMRAAMLEARQFTGLEALLMLARAFEPASLDDLWDLLDKYEGAVVEFSAFAREVGTCPGRNAVIWEVRHY